MAKDGSPAQAFPDNLVLEIVARCRTAADVIRCAATSKPIRSGILSEPFLRCLVRHGDGNGDFIPVLLVGLYHKTNDDPDRPLPFVPVPGGRGNKEYPLPPAPEPDDPSASCRYGSYLAVASRRSLVVLRRKCRVTEQEHLTECHSLHPVELSACNPTTGERLVLPPHDLMDTSHAVLQVTHPLGPSKFKLLLAELSEHAPKTLYVQIFSSEDGCWGDVFPCAIPRACEFVPGPHGRPASPAVVGDTVYWMCNTDVGRHVLSWRWRGGGAGQRQKTSLLKLPSPFVFGDVETCLAVLPSPSSAASLLGLIVLEERGDIQVWVHEDQSGGRFAWDLRHRVQGTPPPLGFGDSWLYGKEIVCFCEGSGTLFLRDGDGENNLTSVQLSLATNNNNNNNKAVRKLEATTWDLPSGADFCPYEIDLLSHMLCGMKTY
ncbi:hypothetical protein QOZ80_1AG0026210 [Eleusine coracana subsp. coracana]|nr:hypothetical protein QOZ80_1AG0026210 [Eleusine coracana subsp. coracana]